MRSTMAKINLTSLSNNIQLIKKTLSPNTALMAIVKANGYGHGAIEIAKKSLNSGATSLGVAIPEEGFELRCAGINCDILVLGGIHRDEIDLVIDNDLSLCIFSIAMAELLNQRAKEKSKNVKVHIKIDSGMGRIGVRNSNDALELCHTLANMDNISVEGIFTHLACADDRDKDYNLIQLESFNRIIKDINSKGIYYKWIHAANTAAIFNYPESHFDIVRAGIGIYGYISQKQKDDGMNLEPILSWHTKVVYKKKIDVGDTISYGRTFSSNEPKIIATLPVGYGDGYNRLLSNRGWVLIKGKKAPIVGNICMDQMMVDITNISNVEIDEEVVLLGVQKGEIITADDLADLCGTISYEILTGITSRVPRLYMED